MNRSAIKPDLFADQEHKSKIDSLGDPLVDIEKHIDFMALAAKVDLVSPRVASPKGGRPAYPIETMVRILVLKRLYNLSDEAMEYQLLDRMSYKRFCGLADSRTIPDRTTPGLSRTALARMEHALCLKVLKVNCSTRVSSPARSGHQCVRSLMPRWFLNPPNKTVVQKES